MIEPLRGPLGNTEKKLNEIIDFLNQREKPSEVDVKPKEQTLTLEETVITALGLCIDHVDYKEFADVIRGWMKERVEHEYKLSTDEMNIVLKALEIE